MKFKVHPIRKACNQHLVLLCWSLLQCYYLSHLAAGMCIDQEREALLKFKAGFREDKCGLLSSWSDHEHNRNCCHWHGVHCNNQTGHVIKLNLRGVNGYEVEVEDNCLQGNVSSSLADLKHLMYLDLSHNFFDNSPIPSFLGSLSKLEYLNLSRSAFQGNIPYQLGNLSRLRVLDLSYMLYNGYDISSVAGYASYMSVENLSWLSCLTSLRYLDLTGADLSKVTDWLQIVTKLPSLRVLRLIYCTLPSKVPWPLSYINSSTTLSFLSLTRNDLNDSSIFQWLLNLSGIDSHLAYLDLSQNQLQGSLPSSFGNLQALTYLDLSNNYLDGTVPSSFGKLQSLSYLSLSHNRFHGQIPDIRSENLTYLDLSSNKFQFWPKTIHQLCSLRELHLDFNDLTEELPSIIQTLTGCANNSLSFLELSNNHIWGSIPRNINALSSLSYLSLGSNQLNGTISRGLGQLSTLFYLNLSSNSLKGSLTTEHFSNLSGLFHLDLSYNPELKIEANPPSQLSTIMLASCNLGPSFPKWLLGQTNYMTLDVSNAGISERIPNSFWNSLSPQLGLLNMSNNNINGTLPYLHQLSSETLPFELDLSFNNFQGAIPSYFSTSFTSLLVNNNKLSDAKLFLCPKTVSTITNLDLSNNFLSGELPDCWMNFSQMSILHLANNNFSGAIPASIGYLNELQALHLRNNSFSGEVPSSLGTLTSLVILDLSHNSLSGSIQQAIGISMESLSYLSLRNNHFSGEIPVTICQLSNLQILDLAMNHITGGIPKCIYNLTAMKTGIDLLPEMMYDIHHENSSALIFASSYTDAATIMWKRKEWSFKNSLGQVKQIDVSHNQLHGEIPSAIFSLAGLVSLDLSSNNLSGTIMEKIGQLTALQFLDLSNNQLSGEIPWSLADLNFLGVLDLSYNHLSGTIPTGTLLQSFDTSAYVGNPDLCGTPLSRCPWDRPPNNNAGSEDNISHKDDNKSEDIFPGMYISILLGFIIGFWLVFGTLIIKA